MLYTNQTLWKVKQNLILRNKAKCNITDHMILINLPVLEIEVSQTGHIDGGVGGGVYATDGDELEVEQTVQAQDEDCLLYTSPSPRD